VCIFLLSDQDLSVDTITNQSKIRGTTKPCAEQYLLPFHSPPTP
jgi:hypothetical protein